MNGLRSRTNEKFRTCSLVRQRDRVNDYGVSMPDIHTFLPHNDLNVKKNERFHTALALQRRRRKIIPHLTRRLPLHIIRIATPEIWRHATMQSPTIPARGIIIDEPIKAPSARIIAVLRVLVFDRGFVPAQPSAVLTIPGWAVVLVEAG